MSHMVIGLVFQRALTIEFGSMSLFHVLSQSPLSESVVRLGISALTVITQFHSAIANVLIHTHHSWNQTTAETAANPRPVLG